jgi:hypothetical protein
MLHEHGASKILGDDRVLPTIHAEDQRWISEDWMPRARAAGLRAAASRSPTSQFGKVAVASVQSAARRDVVIRSFDDLNEAREWLKGLKP